MRAASLAAIGSAALAACSLDQVTFRAIDCPDSCYTALEYVKASNTGPGHQFGRSIALSADGSTLAVGALGEPSAATGIDGNQADGSAEDSGAVYVFTRSGATWRQEAYLKASNTGAGDLFGWSVALSADGTTLAVSAPLEDSAGIGTDANPADDSATLAGAVYVFTRTATSGTTWRQEAYLKASNTGAGDLFGWSVALSADGATLGVGAIAEDSAAPGVDGDQASNTAVDAGAVYVFTRIDTRWSQQTYLKASNPGARDFFGTSLALSGDGATLAVSAPSEDSAATGIDGDQASDAARESGAVYVFTRSVTTWRQEVYVKASNAAAGDEFGTSVALSADGATLAVGAMSEASAANGIGGDQVDDSAPGAGAVYLFTRPSAAWRQAAYLKSSRPRAHDGFGGSVALSAHGVFVAVGTTGADGIATEGSQPVDSSAIGAGAVDTFIGSGSTWKPHARVVAPNPGRDDWFGSRIALSENGLVLAVGAFQEDSAATGIGGDPTGNASANSGAVYVFH